MDKDFHFLLHLHIVTNNTEKIGEITNSLKVTVIGDIQRIDSMEIWIQLSMVTWQIILLLAH